MPSLFDILGSRGDVAAANQPGMLPDAYGASGMAWNSGFGRDKFIQDELRKLMMLRQQQLQASATRNVPAFIQSQMGGRR